ncbi:hypothetical protein HYFRA_00009942 [Hymenoscyphus fraxineus]|uniref:Uncharacterized protein n=1 Tax=Hymenoscyphus fraxineus TaxID=746836 RepID=A0A9N9PWT2_9HELO|nr:hypothetical protein HYFRA_00009942 [Hymenoscyphus fraxineus]
MKPHVPHARSNFVGVSTDFQKSKAKRRVFQKMLVVAYGWVHETGCFSLQPLLQGALKSWSLLGYSGFWKRTELLYCSGTTVVPSGEFPWSENEKLVSDELGGSIPEKVQKDKMIYLGDLHSPETLTCSRLSLSGLFTVEP